ncbi:hypothetical protein ARMSODRAFT_1024228 [Armillaria solidipes]|uniref:Uncharacterized protein n=1 Tax=Armillaria solidipes TaxID=1076256 RepID=A0A2H3AWV4_9AGAR|nr:hypothetical protein ARMSODRAFT_1024228 [Armillaria solidipes]
MRPDDTQTDGTGCSAATSRKITPTIFPFVVRLRGSKHRDPIAPLFTIKMAIHVEFEHTLLILPPELYNEMPRHQTPKSMLRKTSSLDISGAIPVVEEIGITPAHLGGGAHPLPIPQTKPPWEDYISIFPPPSFSLRPLMRETLTY